MSLNIEKQQEAEEVFRDLDRDGNGFIDESELATALRRVGLNPSLKEIQSMIGEVDSDGNRKLDFDEFLRYVKHTYKDPDEIRCNLTEAFKIFDANKDGFISREELKAVLTKMGEKLSEKEFDEMVRVADSNGDGRIDYEEYVNMMCQSTEQMDSKSANCN